MNDEINEAYIKGIEQGQKHNQPSPKTMELISNMSIELKYIKEKLDIMPTKEEMELANRKIVEEILNCADERYAGKLTEKIVYGLIGMVVIAFMTGLIYLVFRYKV